MTSQNMLFVMLGLLKPLEIKMTCGVLVYLNSGIFPLMGILSSFEALPSFKWLRLA